MAKLLVVEGSFIVRGVFKELLDQDGIFEYELVGTYEEAKDLLQKSRYEYAVVEHILSDAPNGEIIPLLNKHNIAPLVFTKEIDEDFFDTFDGAQIVSYIIKHKYNNITNVVNKLKELYENKNRSILIVNDSHIYTQYIKQYLSLHSFKVYTAANNQEAYDRLIGHPEISLVIVEDNAPYVDAKEFTIQVRQNLQFNTLKILQIVEGSNSYFTSSLLSIGSDDYIIKPFSRDEFYVRIYQNIN